MNDMRRTMLWVVFSMSLVLIWDAWNQHSGQPSLFGPAPARPTAVADAPTAPGAATVAVPNAVSPSSPAAVPLPAAVGSATAGAVPAASDTGAAAAAITVRTDLVEATFDSRGGDLVKLALLQHKDHNDRTQPVLLFDRSGQRLYLAQTGLITGQAGLNLPTHLTPMTAAPGPRELAAGESSLVVRFESEAVNGVKLVKTYTLRRGEYPIAVRHEVVNGSDRPVDPQLYLQLVRDGNPPPGESAFYFTFTGPAVYTDANKFSKIDFKDIEKNKPLPEKRANNGWIAMVQHYFASAWLVPEGTDREYRTAKVSDNKYSIAMVLPLGEVAAGASKTHDATLFAGPQEEKKLAALAPGLELVKDYGWFTILSKPLFWLLDKLHSVLGNWGWAIVGLVVLLKMAFYWLNASAYRSMAKMKAVGPRVMELRERYKDNPQQQQQEMMRIYREEKVNPLGGCLPIVAQMPFFIALYWVLLSTVEMRNAPWILWVKDLSVADPYFILPLLMTGSTLFQTWLNPTPPDPMQARLMWIMPMVFSVMFFFFPAGLVLYWLTNNILSIAQQWWINRQLGVAPVVPGFGSKPNT
jgi:YidC/Oxa1 family membrane protein insertase